MGAAAPGPSPCGAGAPAGSVSAAARSVPAVAGPQPFAAATMLLRPRGPGCPPSPGSGPPASQTDPGGGAGVCP